MSSIATVVDDVSTWPPEFVVAVVVFCGLAIASQLCFAYALYHDAVARDRSDPDRQAVLAFLSPFLGPFGLFYFFRLLRIPGRDPSPTKRELSATAMPLGVVAAFVFGAFVAPPDPITQVMYAVPTMLVSIPLAYLLVSKRSGEGSRPEATS
ncbi:hypothetical protein [Haloprofundus sp. MHR1]|uniref:DUF7534 family protein n=1 Tax=Haloprofundus sp. MHR1 TaxID=2572921 RepID=UPI0010BF2F12|nr:hypothetical protein [Haloprofundus sp. MHR1]QCJ46824.1 hypothetical protein FCF25_06740 [Haloprofundus sp. MHR1]